MKWDWYIPAASAGNAAALVGTLRDKATHPSLDVGRVLHVVVVDEDVSVFNEYVGDRRIL